MEHADSLAGLGNNCCKSYLNVCFTMMKRLSKWNNEWMSDEWKNEEKSEEKQGRKEWSNDKMKG